MLVITILRFKDEQVFNDMENVIKEIEFYIFEFEKHTPNPSQEGTERSKNVLRTFLERHSVSYGRVGAQEKDY